ncbi:MAG TPA: MTAP family purine nucleoside phosphorylase [Syntrophales bacterium]|nr:MTAP family purine nucleoside phosphorylase [Syntrophales bacterium]
MEPLGIISGIILLQGKGIFQNLKKKEIATKYGKALVFLSDAVAFIPRHGKTPKHHILPHLINNQANLKALKDIGVKEVIGVNSTGSLKKKLKPGTIVVPDDFIMLTGTPTAIHGKAFHITPKLSFEVRQKWIDAAHDCAIKVVDGGVYWQTTGPRLETKAEIKMMSRFADLVGMTMASEATIAQELGMSYAALCSVDNYGHGLGEMELTIEEILQHARRNTDVILKIIMKYIERRRG